MNEVLKNYFKDHNNHNSFTSHFFHALWSSRPNSLNLYSHLCMKFAQIRPSKYVWWPFYDFLRLLHSFTVLCIHFCRQKQANELKGCCFNFYRAFMLFYFIFVYPRNIRTFFFYANDKQQLVDFHSFPFTTVFMGF